MPKVLEWGNTCEHSPDTMTQVLASSSLPPFRRSMHTLYILWCAVLGLVAAIELTFELPDNANQCFYEDMKAGIDSVIEFQVVTGGKYDVDMTLEDPSGKVLYKDVKKQYDSYSWKTAIDGTYKACFSNEFSTFTHKIVYMDWQKGNEGLLKTTPRLAAMSQLETSASGISDRLRLIDDYQTHHRLREATGRKRAEELNERVMLWSLGQTCVILLIGVAQKECLQQVSELTHLAQRNHTDFLGGRGGEHSSYHQPRQEGYVRSSYCVRFSLRSERRSEFGAVFIARLIVFRSHVYCFSDHHTNGCVMRICIDRRVWRFSSRAPCWMPPLEALVSTFSCTPEILHAVGLLVYCSMSAHHARR
uniref:GOLD domain-containing protein n=1 Tax=Ascaris lumbricoides TaxID=6252 RepID=A0A9J2P0Y6_ASCLU